MILTLCCMHFNNNEMQRRSCMLQNWHPTLEFLNNEIPASFEKCTYNT